MARFEVRVKHQLTIAEAIDRLQPILQRLQRGGVSQISGFTYQWNGPICDVNFNALGGRGIGQLNVRLSEVVVTGELKGFALSLAKGQLESQLSTQLEEVLTERQTRSR